MKQTFTRTWAKLRAYRHEATAGALSGLLLGILCLSHGGSYQAHFFQKAAYQEPKESVVRNAPVKRAKVRRKAMSSNSSASRKLAGPVTPGKRTVMNTTDSPLRPAAPQSASSSSFLQVRSNVADSAPVPVSSHSAAASTSDPIAIAAEQTAFPPLIRTVHPVTHVPNWGAMRTPEIWNRTYQEMNRDDFVSVPAYDLQILTIPMSTLTHPITDDAIPKITAKLYYSTRPWGAYDVDAAEHSGTHDGVDLKLAIGTPVAAIGGGRIMDVATTETLGLHVLLEHRAGGQRYVSIYGHLQSASVRKGQAVQPGQTIGAVGMTGTTSGPHLHLAVHTAAEGEDLRPYDLGQSVHPIEFIARYRLGE
jgi:murein DD-endopeptidase MepM/ murein hydrolase activator NlpD